MRVCCRTLLFWSLVGCKDETGTVVKGHDTGETGEETGSPETGSPAAPSDDVCARFVPGPSSSKDAVIGLSEAHADYRLFGPTEDFATADAALITALKASSTDAPDLDAYAEAAGICAADAADTALGAASVEVRGSLAWIRPGSGEVTLPEGALGVVIDLRDLPADPDLSDALANALAPAIATDAELPALQVRVWYGFTDQVFSSSNAYKTRVRRVDSDPVVADGPADLPLVLVTGAEEPPAAVRFAAGLVMAGRAWIVGEDLMSEVGELHWAPVGSRGLAFRDATLSWDDAAIPDILPATSRTTDPETALVDADPASWSAPAIPDGETTREDLPKRSPWDEATPDEAADVETLEAALIVAHGTVRRFWHYFDVEGDGIDDRLEEVLARPLDPDDRDGMVEAIGRFGEVLHDGHVFFGDYYGDGPVGYLPVTLDHIDGRPVIVRSMDPGLLPGDTITAVDGEDIETLYADLESWHGAATEGYTLDLAGRELSYLDGPTTYDVLGADGVAREVTVDPYSYDDWASDLFVFHDRASGLLDDLDASDIAYLNMDFEVTTDLDQVSDLLALASGATGLVVDMRGYPGVDHYAVAEALIPEGFQSPIFDVYGWSGAESVADSTDQYSYPGSADAYTGPIVLLTSPITVSAAENFSMMLTGADRVTVVGRNSAGTNGNITGARLPGGFYFTFTGMQVLFPDGSRFHGVGIQPDVEVVPTPQDYADGRDPELEAAIEVLRGM